MLKLSKKVEYGLMAVLHMDSLADDVLATAKEVSDQFRIPSELMGKVLQSLARAGIAESVHGARGGYRLKQPLEALTLGDVMEAIEGPVHIVKCHEHPGQCDQYGACNIREPVIRIQNRLSGYLQAFQLSEFRGESQRVPVAKVEK